MVAIQDTQQARAIALLRKRGMARASELAEADITPATIARMLEKGLIVRLGRGLYQLADAPIATNHSLAEAAKLVSRGVICLVSALAFHELTDAMPPRIWMAIGSSDRRPSLSQPPLEFVRFPDKLLHSGIGKHRVEGVDVPIYAPAKTIVDLFRYRQRQGRRYQKSPGLNLALEGMREALRKRKATPAEIARYAEEAGIWRVVQPYLEAMTVDA
jgi:predicted transcriptional regulator of viral defense system